MGSPGRFVSKLYGRPVACGLLSGVFPRRSSAAAILAIELADGYDRAPFWGQRSGQHLAARDASMIPASESFDGTFPFAAHYTTAPGFRMHYVDEGAGPVIICLHGQPTWGYLYRKFIPPLSKDYRVIVPDHMGFGKSETPPDLDYTLKTHVENLAALVTGLDLRDMTIVAQDWGGPIAGAFTLRH